VVQAKRTFRRAAVRHNRRHAAAALPRRWLSRNHNARRVVVDTFKKCASDPLGLRKLLTYSWQSRRSRRYATGSTWFGSRCECCSSVRGLGFDASVVTYICGDVNMGQTHLSGRRRRYPISAKISTAAYLQCSVALLRQFQLRSCAPHPVPPIHRSSSSPPSFPPYNLDSLSAYLRLREAPTYTSRMLLTYRLCRFSHDGLSRWPFLFRSHITTSPSPPVDMNDPFNLWHYFDNNVETV
jgi:hypothetical protein